MIVRTWHIFFIFKKCSNTHYLEYFFQSSFLGEVFPVTRGTGPIFLNPLRQLWPKYIDPGRGTRRFHMHLLMFLLLQQLQPLQRPPHTHPQRRSGRRKMHMKSLSLSARSYIFRPQLAKRIQESWICAPCRGEHLTKKRSLEQRI